MIFPYWEVRFDHEVHWLPLLPITVHGRETTLELLALVDSGAEYSVLGLDVADRLQISLADSTPVMLDRDLARLYGVKTIALRQQVKRNVERFPPDFMFQLSREEAELLVSQNVIPSRRSLGGSLPYVFTQEGVAMLSSVLRSRRAVLVNVAVMRAFVRLRELLATHKDLARKLAELEKKYDHQFQVVFQAIRALMEPPPSEGKRGRIGFRAFPEE